MPMAIKWSIPINTLLDNSPYKVLDVSFRTIPADQKHTAFPSNQMISAVLSLGISVIYLKTLITVTKNYFWER